MRAGLDSHQQRLRLSDLGHFGRRRKALERGYEHRVGVSRAGCRSVKLGERQRSLQAEATRAWPIATAMAILKASSAAAGCSGRTSAGCHREDDARTRDPSGIRLDRLRQGFVDTVQSVLRFRRLCLEFLQSSTSKNLVLSFAPWSALCREGLASFHRLGRRVPHLTARRCGQQFALGAEEDRSLI